MTSQWKERRGMNAKSGSCLIFKWLMRIQELSQSEPACLQKLHQGVTVTHRGRT